ncbi:hypothetical protein [Acidipropionibacterium virtanenii]|uniref:Secreted protein n=1 Tax=Acidipropionibacterium virtanenii TaxID=2057246 RepID=A0A344URF2_9ACTN|nr:hypothetical protein [Acidipropionibacterium virtanenii]AXE37850.1 hypothetical protein JS278_00659 [Acidipropionibacterium virtanenii]
MRRTLIPAALLSAGLLVGLSACDGSQTKGSAAASPSASSVTASPTATTSSVATTSGSADPKAQQAASSVLAKAPSAAADVGTLQFKPGMVGAVTTTLHVTGLHRSGNTLILTFWAQGANPDDGTVMLSQDPTTVPYLVDPSARTKHLVDTYTGADGKPWAVVSEAVSTNTDHPDQMEARYTVPGSTASFQVGIERAVGGRTVTVPVS